MRAEAHNKPALARSKPAPVSGNTDPLSCIANVAAVPLRQRGRLRASWISRPPGSTGGHFGPNDSWFWTPERRIRRTIHAEMGRFELYILLTRKSRMIEHAC